VTPVELRAGRMARLGAAYNLGFILGPFVGGILANPHAGTAGYHLPLLLSSALAGCSGPRPSLLVVKESRERRHDMGPQPSRWVMLGFAVRHPVVGRLMLLTFSVGVAFTAIESTFALWGAAPGSGWEPREIGLCFGRHRRSLGRLPVPFDRPVIATASAKGRMLAAGMAGTVLCNALQDRLPGRYLHSGPDGG